MTKFRDLKMIKVQFIILILYHMSFISLYHMSFISRVFGQERHKNGVHKLAYFDGSRK